MMRNPFIFVDGWVLYSNNGNKTRILKKDLKEAKKNGVSEEDIKIMAYQYLTEPTIMHRETITENMYKDYEL